MRFLPGPVLALALLASACSAASGGRPLVYAALGASDAVGVGVADPTRDGWVYQLGRKLPAGTRVVNLGISGSTLHQALSDQLPVALDAHPDLVTVWLVVNDYLAGVPLAQYEADLDTLLGTLAANGSPRVYVGNLPDIGWPAVNGASAADWNATIARVTAAHGATLVDLDADLKAPGSWADLVSADGFHPNARGYGQLADAFCRRIEAHGIAF